VTRGPIVVTSSTYPDSSRCRPATRDDVTFPLTANCCSSLAPPTRRASPPATMTFAPIVENHCSDPPRPVDGTRWSTVSR